MSSQEDPKQNDQRSAFEKEASAKQTGLLAEFLHFLLNNKKWWLTPIIVVLLLVAVLIVLSGSAAAPFIYTLF
jgi:membrane glycosyltransferase